jgi:hypothetical protein
MPLLAFWKSAPGEVRKLTIEQVVANAGDGLLRDQSSCSEELREYFLQIPSEHIATYIDPCLASGFSKGGMVLQDLVNELGRRLGYTVENGRYQGTSKAVGFDGLWSSPDRVRSSLRLRQRTHIASHWTRSLLIEASYPIRGKYQGNRLS